VTVPSGPNLSRDVQRLNDSGGLGESIISVEKANDEAVLMRGRVLPSPEPHAWPLRRPGEVEVPWVTKGL
jgi:hypothetical protein